MDMQKLAKVLAMAGSENETEATHALRMAKKILAVDGLDFIDLAKSVAAPASSSVSPTASNDVLHNAIFDLRNEVRQLRAENHRLKQGMPTAAPAPAQSFHDSARDAATVIRLRSELDSERAQTARLKQHESLLRQQLTDILAEADDLRRRLSDAESRRMRSDVENRRLLHANHALDVENCELRSALAAQDDAPPPVKLPRPAARPVARGVEQAAIAAPIQQYSLL